MDDFLNRKYNGWDVHAMLHKAFDYAVSVGLLARNVCVIVSLPRVEKYEARSLTLEQVQQLLSAAKGHRVEALRILVLVTGMRRGEMFGLKWSDINLSSGLVSVQRSLVDVKGGIIESKPKSSKGYRSILLPSFAINELRVHKEGQIALRESATKWQDGDYVFCTSHGTPFAAANLAPCSNRCCSVQDCPTSGSMISATAWHRSC